jgi:hypothetical protein
LLQRGTMSIIPSFNWVTQTLPQLRSSIGVYYIICVVAYLPVDTSGYKHSALVGRKDDEQSLQRVPIDRIR